MQRLLLQLLKNMEVNSFHNFAIDNVSDLEKNGKVAVLFIINFKGKTILTLK